MMFARYYMLLLIRIFKENVVLKNAHLQTITTNINQKEIYFVSGDKLESLKSSPHLEVFKSKDYEVLFFTDSIDEFMVESLGEYDGKKFVSVVKGNIDLESDKSKKEERENR